MKQQGDGAGETSITTNYELRGTGQATRAPVAQTLQTVRQRCSCTTATCPYRFARFPFCGIFTPTLAIPVKITSCNNRVTVPVKPQEHTNYELHYTGRATRAPVAQTLQSVRQTCSCTTATRPYAFARFPSCGIFTPTRTIPVTITSETTG